MTSNCYLKIYQNQGAVLYQKERWSITALDSQVYEHKYTLRISSENNEPQKLKDLLNIFTEVEKIEVLTHENELKMILIADSAPSYSINTSLKEEIHILLKDILFQEV